MSSPEYTYQAATLEQLDRRWQMNIAQNQGDNSWVRWKHVYIRYNIENLGKTFVILRGDEPVGEGTLLFSPACGAIGGRKDLADGLATANINALRVDEPYRGQGHMSRLVKVMEAYAKDCGCSALTIGVEAAEARNLAIYLHWGYTSLVRYEKEEGQLVLYYSKRL